MLLVQASGLFLSGHLFGALLVYLNHRFVLHGRLGDTRLLRWAKKLHALHHKFAYGPFFSSFAKTPLSVKLTLAACICLLCALCMPLGLGFLTALCYYEVMHRLIHSRLRQTAVGQHHEMHHKFPHYNFSGTYPFIDHLFGTKRG